MKARNFECLPVLPGPHRATHPRDPFTLADWSFGAVLAYEIAQLADHTPDAPETMPLSDLTSREAPPWAHTTERDDESVMYSRLLPLPSRGEHNPADTSNSDPDGETSDTDTSERETDERARCASSAGTASTHPVPMILTIDPEADAPLWHTDLTHR